MFYCLSNAIDSIGQNIHCVKKTTLMLHTIDSTHSNRLGKHEPGNCIFSVRHRRLLENVGGSEQNRSVIATVQSDDLWPSRMHAATHILQEKTHACGVLKRISGFMFP